MLYSITMHAAISRLRGRLQHGLATQEILDRLARVGLVLYPYLVFREFPDRRFSRGKGTEAFRARQLTENDIPHLAGIPGRPRTAAEICERFRRGHVAVGAFDGERIVAYTWCDFEKLAGAERSSVLRKLESDEAYLYDAYALPDYRGRELVPFLRSEVYKVMQAQGRHRLYSISLFFNRSARRFKAKLGASKVELRLSINLFKKWQRDLLLRRYSAEHAGAPD